MPIHGEWYNEFGSQMTIAVPPGSPGELHGFYVSQVGEATGSYQVSGRLGESEDPARGVPLGWTVSWQNEHRNAFSVTSWNGTYLQESEQILATWLLTHSMDAGHEWEATVIGHDVFQREKPASGDVERAMDSRRPVPHPLTS